MKLLTGNLKKTFHRCRNLKRLLLVFALSASFFSFNKSLNAQENAAAYHNQGWEQVNTGNFAKAEELFRKALRLNAGNGNFQRSLGWLLYDKLNRAAEAIVYLTKAVNLLPNDTLPLLDLGLAYDKLKKYDMVVAAFDRALVIFKRQNQKPQAWVYLSAGSSCIWGIKPANNKKAIRYLRAIIENDYDKNSKKTAYNWLSYALLELKQYNELLLTMNKAIEFDNTFALFYRRKAAALQNLGRLNESLEVFLKAIPLSQNEPWVYVEISNVYIQLKKYKDAIESYEKAISVFNQTNQKIPVWIYNNICAWSLFSINPRDYARVIKYANLIIKNDYETQQKKNAYEYLAHAYYQQSRLKTALKYAKLAGADFWITKLLSPRTIIFNMKFDFKKLMKKIYTHVSPGVISFHLPMNTEYQKFVSLESSPPYKKIVKKGRSNTVVYDFSNGFPALLKLKLTIKNEIINQSPASLNSYSGTDTQISYFANLITDYYDLNHPVLKNLVKKITEGIPGLKDKVIAVHKWIVENIPHIAVLNPNITPAEWPNYRTVSEIIKGKKGHCAHISAVFMAMCRMLKIPVRMINGITISADTKKITGKTEWHYVVELYDTVKKRWIYVEPQSLSNFGINQFWHVVFDTEIRTQTPANHLRLNDFLFETQYHYPQDHCTYSVVQ